MKTIYKINKPLQVISLYIVILAGGFWHVFGMFQPLMTAISGLLMAVLSICIFFSYLPVIRGNPEKSGYVFWSMTIFILSLLLEIIGVKTGSIFGNYSYGETLWPSVLGVPLAIGFAWFNMVMGSLAIASFFFRDNFTRFPFTVSIISALLMVAFDLVMEPAAVILNYWTWENGIIPLHNYFTWFVAGFVFIYSALKYKIIQGGIPFFIVHTYLAQLGYFVIVIIGN